MTHKGPVSVPARSFMEGDDLETAGIVINTGVGFTINRSDVRW